MKLYEITELGKSINPKDLTADFHWHDKTVPIGKFALDTYPTTYPLLSWNELHDHVIEQLLASKMLTTSEMESIGSMDVEQFVDCIVER
jgi:hypothetical protein